LGLASAERTGPVFSTERRKEKNMATATISPNSPVPTQVRNYHTTVGPTIYNNVEKAIQGAITHAAARTNVTSALATIVTGGSPAPTKWAIFTSAVDQVINCSEAAPTKDERIKLFKTASLYLKRLLDDIAKEEAAFQRNRGLFILNSAALNLNYLVGVLDEAMANNQTITFEAS
jgi:hypothetical protein